MLNNIIIIISFTTFWSGVVYRIYALNTAGVIISLILVLVSCLILHRFSRKNNRIRELFKKTPATRIFNFQLSAFNLILLSTYLILNITCFIILFFHTTGAPIISLWQVVPFYFFIIYGLATLLLIFYASKFQYANSLLISLHYLLSFSGALIVYKLGYGFDPFIHRATLDLIDKTGSVDPKPFYYLGQYGLITLLHKITFIPLAWLDKLLVPILSAALIPAALLPVLKKWFDNKINPALLALILLIFPFSFFIATTPQNLGYLFLLLALIYGLHCKNLSSLLIIYLLALAALITHPIAGIPALLFAFLLTIFYSDIRYFKKYLYYLAFIIASASLPLAFIFFENKTGALHAISMLENDIISLPDFIIPGQENFILNFIYLYGFNLKTIFLLLAAAGIIIAYKNKQACRFCFIYLSMAAALFISYCFTKKIAFAYLIDYERFDFTGRILVLSLLFLLPFFLLAIQSFFYKLKEQNKIIKISFFIFITALITASLYLSYPRFDNYHNSHSYAVSQNDIDAIKWIEKNASSSDYIVLANQQVSAAALSQFGFKKYYQNEIFYYPIPTGGPLYQFYLDMVYKKPSRETMIAAMKLAGVSQGYFVLNEYWWAFPKILNEAKLTADSWKKFADGKIYVFSYSQ
ncbi:MAG: hypothetical protein U9R06_02205 [Patescibacteria group bacterium]|nr:hypothetical protein [Patescibacteria group bacterium]